jgi:hypothetical protein
MDALFVLREGEQFKEISIVGGQLQVQIETPLTPITGPLGTRPV